MRISLIAAVAKNGVIGRKGGLPWHLPDDFAWFKRQTLGQPIVMGRRTQESMRAPLPGRTNIVVSSTPPPPPYLHARSVDEAIALAGDALELWVIGGAGLYAAFLPRADRLVLTEIDGEPEGDTFFPDWDRSQFELAEVAAHGQDERHAFPFRFATYVRRAS